MSTQPPNSIILDGESLTPEDLYKLGFATHKIHITEETWARVEKSRKIVDDIVDKKEIVYGISTGFGNFASVNISSEDVSKLQTNLIRSHAVGVGPALTIERARRLFALRINVLAKGHSGIRPENLKKMIDIFNKDCIPYVPEQGTVGASGDLAPLAHVALGLMGEGKMWNPKTKSWGCGHCGDEKYHNCAGEILKENGCSPIQLAAKEGLALINGTQLITSLGIEALMRAKNLIQMADIIAAISLEALEGVKNCFDARIHRARPHKGQMLVAERMRKLFVTGRQMDVCPLNFNSKRVQDAYTLRCIPQVHGIVYDTLEFVEGILHTELNSGTDNPMLFIEEDGPSELPYESDKDMKVVSGGNFHGEYPAKCLDYLSIGINELANFSERRTERLVNSTLSNGLPAFLIEKGGLNSGFMIVHYTAAAITSENKTLVHPGSSDTIPTSAGQEDHVSMGGWAARKALRVLDNVENVLGIELLSACQGIDLRKRMKQRKSQGEVSNYEDEVVTTPCLNKVWKIFREHVKFLDEDRYLHPDIVEATEFVKSGKAIEAVADILN